LLKDGSKKRIDRADNMLIINGGRFSHQPFHTSQFTNIPTKGVQIPCSTAFNVTKIVKMDGTVDSVTNSYSYRRW
jgi:hypothetical protein